LPGSFDSDASGTGSWHTQWAVIAQEGSGVIFAADQPPFAEAANSIDDRAPYERRSVVPVACARAGVPLCYFLGLVW
jgi:hypothetical protein